MKWINVKERLPKPKTEVLTFDGKHINTCVFFNESGEFEDWGSIPASNFPECLTHWMPLPEVPK